MPTTESEIRKKARRELSRIKPRKKPLPGPKPISTPTDARGQRVQVPPREPLPPVSPWIYRGPEDICESINLQADALEMARDDPRVIAKRQEALLAATPPPRKGPELKAHPKALFKGTELLRLRIEPGPKAPELGRPQAPIVEQVQAYAKYFGHKLGLLLARPLHGTVQRILGQEPTPREMDDLVDSDLAIGLRSRGWERLLDKEGRPAVAEAQRQQMGFGLTLAGGVAEIAGALPWFYAIAGLSGLAKGKTLAKAHDIGIIFGAERFGRGVLQYETKEKALVEAAKTYAFIFAFSLAAVGISKAWGKVGGKMKPSRTAALRELGFKKGTRPSASQLKAALREKVEAMAKDLQASPPVRPGGVRPADPITALGKFVTKHPEVPFSEKLWRARDAYDLLMREGAKGAQARAVTAALIRTGKVPVEGVRVPTNQVLAPLAPRAVVRPKVSAARLARIEKAQKEWVKAGIELPGPRIQPWELSEPEFGREYMVRVVPPGVSPEKVLASPAWLAKKELEQIKKSYEWDRGEHVKGMQHAEAWEAREVALPDKDSIVHIYRRSDMPRPSNRSAKQRVPAGLKPVVSLKAENIAFDDYHEMMLKKLARSSHKYPEVLVGTRRAVGTLTQKEAWAISTYPRSQRHEGDKGIEFVPASETPFIDSALRKIPPTPATTYRVVSFIGDKGIKDFLEKHQKGKIVTYPTYTASYGEARKDKAFGAPTAKDIQPLVVSLTIHGKSGRRIAEWANPRLGLLEDEVLFPRGVRFRVDSVKKRADGRNLIEITEVAPGPLDRQQKIKYGRVTAKLRREAEARALAKPEAMVELALPPKVKPTPPKEVKDDLLRASVDPEEFSGISRQHRRYQNYLTVLVESGAITEDAARALRLIYTDSNLWFMKYTRFQAHEVIPGDPTAAGLTTHETDNVVLKHLIQIATDGGSAHSGLATMVHETGHIAWVHMTPAQRQVVKDIFHSLWGGKWTPGLGDAARIGLHASLPRTRMIRRLDRIYPHHPVYAAYAASGPEEFWCQELFHSLTFNKITSLVRMKDIIRWSSNFMTDTIARILANRAVTLSPAARRKLDELAEMAAGFRPGIREELPTEVFKAEIEERMEVRAALKPGKQPWEMTEKEYQASQRVKDTELRRRLEKEIADPKQREIAYQIEKSAGYSHRMLVLSALHKGKPVPSKVLAEYPGLKEKVELMKKGKAALKPKPGVITHSHARTLAKRVLDLKAEIVGKKGAEYNAIQEQLKSAQRELRAGGFVKGSAKRKDLFAEARTLPKAKGLPSKKRPVKIGRTEVITLQTEQRIQALRQRLMASGSLTQEAWEADLFALGIKDPRFIDTKHFITEKKAKKLIARMNDEAFRIKEDGETKDALRKKGNEGIRDLHDKIRRQVPKKKKKGLARISPLRSMRYYAMRMEEQTGLDFFNRWSRLNRGHLEVQKRIADYHKRLKKAHPNYEALVKDLKASQRVNDYIESKLPKSPKKSPKDITSEEVTLAKELEAIFEEFRPFIRLHRFTNYYFKGEPIPDAPQAALDEATRIYEEEGVDALTKWLETQDWGIIKSGYAPEVIFKGKVIRGRPAGISFDMGYVHVRTADVLPEQERTIFQRTNAYLRGMLNKTLLEPKVRDLVRLYDENVSLFANPATVGEELGQAINESLGHVRRGGRMERVMRRMAAMAIRTTFLKPHMSFRNLHQNAAMNQDWGRMEWAHPLTNTFLSPSELEYYHTYVSQMRPFTQQYLMHEEKPLPGFKHIVGFTDKISYYAWMDEANRQASFFMRLNRTRRAFKGFNKAWVEGKGDVGSLSRAVEKAGMLTLEDVQLKKALEILAEDGFKAMNHYASGAHTMNVNFPYDRAQRSPVEMGPTGRVLGSLMAFPRGWGERYVLQARKLKGAKDFSSRKAALGGLLYLTVGGMVIGEVYKKATGKKRNPYNPFNIILWVPGGLVMGATDELGELVSNFTWAIRGDKPSLYRLTSQIPRLAKMFVPLYDLASNITDAATGMENADRYALRLIRTAIDKQAKVRKESYVRERTLLEAFQKAFFGGELGKRPERYYMNQAARLRKLIGDRVNLPPEDQEMTELYIKEVKENLIKGGYDSMPRVVELYRRGIDENRIDYILREETKAEGRSLDTLFEIEDMKED